MEEEKLNREQAERLEAEIREQRKREYREALLELLKDCPEEIYSCVIEVIKRLRADAHREIGRRAEGMMTKIGILVLLGLAAIGYWWTRH